MKPKHFRPSFEKGGENRLGCPNHAPAGRPPSGTRSQATSRFRKLPDVGQPIQPGCDLGHGGCPISDHRLRQIDEFG